MNKAVEEYGTIHVGRPYAGGHICEIYPNHNKVTIAMPDGEIKHVKLEKVLARVEKEAKEEEEKEEKDEVDYEGLTKEYVEWCGHKGLRGDDATNM